MVKTINKKEALETLEYLYLSRLKTCDKDKSERIKKLIIDTIIYNNITEEERNKIMKITGWTTEAQK